MEFYLSKTLNFFINPLHILFLIIFIQLFLIFFIKSQKKVIFFSKFFLILFLFFGYTPLSNFLLNKIEDYIQSSKYPVQQLTGVIILGGSFDYGLESKERNQVFLNSSAERLTTALEIYKKNPRILILFSGSSEKSKSLGWSETDMAKKFFLDQGLKLDSLIFENQSRNTFENVKNSIDIVANYKGTWGLITSASHMPRSFFAFKKQSLILEPINVDYKTGTSRMFWINFDISLGLSNWRIILHELIGISYYKITNKI
jgi:uncharacterized SAM-binding protein YcdF (DUF218 family)